MLVGNELGFPTYLLCHYMSCVLLAKGRRGKTGLVAGELFLACDGGGGVGGRGKK